ncbi:MAG: AAA family ATPase [Thermodesulfobacteriota bacterium]|nr:AAA family ATPase [Thermodesulfobacteriota bacterium]
MTMILAMAGKGGTGKTTIAGLFLRLFLEHGIRPVLAVDADANANLNEVLGVDVETTLGEAREGIKDGVPTGMTRDVYMEYKVAEALVEGEGYDLVVMGRPEGPGCYCHANTLLSRCVERLCRNYRVVIMDNEAGMEHISRLVARRADILFIISDPTQRGVLAAQRIRDLCQELNLDVKETHVIINRVKGELPPAVRGAMEAAGLSLAGCVPEDGLISQYDTEGQPTVELPHDASSMQALHEIFESIITMDSLQWKLRD